MSREIPVANRYLDQKWKEIDQKKHRDKCLNMKPAIDNKPPPEYAHIKNKTKTRLLQKGLHF